MPPQATVPDFADDLVARVADREHLMAARAALQLLIRPSVWFSRCAWAGLDHTQVSQALRVPVGTVRSRLSRARTRLRGLTEQELARSAKPGGKARQRQPGSG
jgi:RNA polymerase sigma-70 factor (ECF subfamily)